MLSRFKKNFRRAVLWATASFVVLFIGRLAFGYLVKRDAQSLELSDSNFFETVKQLRKNYASEKVSLTPAKLEGIAGNANSQRFERTANIKTATSKYNEDTRQIYARTKTLAGIIQYEHAAGQEGNRTLHLMIGVQPELFDSLYQALLKIGKIYATDITKVDKTTEYRQLNANKTSLEKTLAALNELKAKGGSIADFIELNDKILDIEDRIQNLGVELGNFDAENEFCTIKLSLFERASAKQISLLHRMHVAFVWTVRAYAVIVFTLLCLSLLVATGLYISDKAKTFFQKDDKPSS
ncbi:MAG: hypothetical protein RL660_1559 [Bacteroidota bacterium]|jgi:uncharacterized protein YfcZ (UPF0381/DUF406 family)